MYVYINPYSTSDHSTTRLKVHAMDVDTAFLNAPINEDIWVQVPNGTELPVGDNGMYKLKKSPYGLKQAPREWNQMINGVLLDMGFEPLEAMRWG